MAFIPMKSGGGMSNFGVLYIPLTSLTYKGTFTIDFSSLYENGSNIESFLDITSSGGIAKKSFKIIFGSVYEVNGGTTSGKHTIKVFIDSTQILYADRRGSLSACRDISVSVGSIITIQQYTDSNGYPVNGEICLLVKTAD